ncbi:MAG: hypothetical protein PWP12_945 [Bacillota bacterium]|nr:hypothetical protein [Bacillota bacterium]MDK2882552.1 hypothetical protein [Bacillota bacterium]MDK2960761.1 hypothetical protein [Bacillota bacterium]
MELTVLGRHGPYPAAGGACSGYLITSGETRLLVDCGAGVLGRLVALFSPENLTGVILSHLHSDHTSDYFVLRYALEVAHFQGRQRDPLPVWAPAEPAEEFARLDYRGLVNVHKVEEGQAVEIGGIKAVPFAGRHSVPSYGWLLTGDGATLAYSGDTEFFPELEEKVRGADLFLCEATYSEVQLAQGARNHLTAAQAAAVARCAGVGRLLLTHLSPPQDLAVLLREAGREFAAVALAEEGRTYPVGA